jgi:hypothetical protein
MKKPNMIILFIIILTITLPTAFAALDVSSIKAISLSLINQDPDPAIAGDIVEIRVGVENRGGIIANNIILELVPSYPFTLIPGQTAAQLLGTMNAYQGGNDIIVVKYKVKVDREATAGQYELKLKEYEQDSKVSTEKTINIDVKNKENAEVIHIDKTTLIPGKQTSLKFTVNNMGNAPLRDLTFYWENEDKIILPVGSDNTKYLNYVEIGKGAEMEYEVIADTNADPGLYELNLHLTYDDPLSGEDKTISTIAGVYVGGPTDFDVAFSENSNGETSFSVANIGSNPAYSVSVMLPRQKSWRTTGSNSVIIGNLNKGDYTVASFSLQSTSSTSKESSEIKRTKKTSGNKTARNNEAMQNSITIEIAYTDTMGERRVVEKDVQINPTAMNTANSAIMGKTGRSSFQKQSFTSKYKWWIIVIVLIIIFIGYKKYKAKKLVNPDFKIKNFWNKNKK